MSYIVIVHKKTNKIKTYHIVIKIIIIIISVFIYVCKYLTYSLLKQT